jgi:hypothetical protein
MTLSGSFLTYFARPLIIRIAEYAVTVIAWQYGTMHQSSNPKKVRLENNMLKQQRSNLYDKKNR